VTALRLVDGTSPTGDTDPDLEAFLEWGRELRGLRPNTLRTRKDVLGRMQLQTGKRLRELTEPDLLAWERTFVVGRAPETRRAYLSHLRSFFAWAVKARIVDRDPTHCLTQPKLVRGLPRPMPEDELRKAVDLARPKMRLMILLGAFCGLRCQEIAGLHWSDLSQQPGGQTVLMVREGKGGKERVVPVPVVVMEAMLAYGRKRSGPMFYGQDARQMLPNSVSQSLTSFFRRHGINCTAHQLRHRYATTAYQLSKDLRMIQELLGHSSPTTTARYAAYDKSQVADVVKAMDEQWLSEPEIDNGVTTGDGDTRAEDGVGTAEASRGRETHRPTVNDLGLLRGHR
jgi:integrase/recombinase XerC